MAEVGEMILLFLYTLFRHTYVHISYKKLKERLYSWYVLANLEELILKQI